MYVAKNRENYSVSPEHSPNFSYGHTKQTPDFDKNSLWPKALIHGAHTFNY